MISSAQFTAFQDELQKIAATKWKGVFDAANAGRQDLMKKMPGAFGGAVRQHASNLERAAVNPAAHQAEMRGLGSMRRSMANVPEHIGRMGGANAAQEATAVSKSSKLRAADAGLAREGRVQTGSGIKATDALDVEGHSLNPTRTGVNFKANPLERSGTVAVDMSKVPVRPTPVVNNGARTAVGTPVPAPTQSSTAGTAVSARPAPRPRPNPVGYEPTRIAPMPAGAPA